jgi:hypothetical protein
VLCVVTKSKFIKFTSLTVEFQFLALQVGTGEFQDTALETEVHFMF